MSENNEYGQYDGQYGQYQNNDENNDYPDQMDQQNNQDEDYQTKVQMDYFEAEELLRKNLPQQCVKSLEEIYLIAHSKDLKNYKVKILNFLLQIYCRANDHAHVKSTLQRISQLNKNQKYTQNAIKSIIVTVKSLSLQGFNKNKNFVYGFIEQLDNLGKLRSYLLFLQKAIDQNDLLECQRLFSLIKTIQSLIVDIPAGSMIELYSFQIRYGKKINKNISKQVRKMQLKLSNLQAQSYMSDGHISIVKEAIAESLYFQQNWKQCSTFLCQAFQQNMKYCKSAEVKKNLLKTNVLVALLIDDKQIFSKDKFNALYHESASSFKSQNDIQCLYGIVQAYQNCDLTYFIQQIKQAHLQQLPFPYQQLLDKVILQLKMSKLLQIIKPYTKIKSSYLQRRLNSSKMQVEKMLFALITDNKIQGRIRKLTDQTYLDINSKKDQFLSSQLQNIKQISKRYL